MGRIISADLPYEVTPSADRIHLSKDLALAKFFDVWTSDVSTLGDLGPHLTCSETEALADLFAAHGHHYFVDALRESHVLEDDEGDLNHNTLEYGS